MDINQIGDQIILMVRFSCLRLIVLLSFVMAAWPVLPAPAQAARSDVPPCHEMAGNADVDTGSSGSRDASKGPCKSCVMLCCLAPLPPAAPRLGDILPPAKTFNPAGVQKLDARSIAPPTAPPRA